MALRLSVEMMMDHLGIWVMIQTRVIVQFMNSYDLLKYIVQLFQGTTEMAINVHTPE